MPKPRRGRSSREPSADTVRYSSANRRDVAGDAPLADYEDDIRERSDVARAEYRDDAVDDHRMSRDTAEAFGFSRPPHHPFAGVARPERRGRFFGIGPKGYRRSDERIREEVSDRLMSHPDIDASDIEVGVANGIVTLSGTVEDRHEKRLADYIAEDALGVDDVDNRLKVRHGFWAAITGERSTEREMPRRTERELGTASREGGRANSARNAARRDVEAL